VRHLLYQQRKERKQETMTEAEYDKLPVINWKEILGSNRGPFKRRPRRMHNSMYLTGVCWWVEKLFGVPRNAIRFVRGNGQLIAPEDHYLVNVKQLQEEFAADPLNNELPRRSLTIHWQLVAQLAKDRRAMGHGMGVYAGSTRDGWGPLAAFVEGFEWLHGGSEALVLFDPQFVPADNEQFAAFKAAFEARIRGGNVSDSEIMPGYWVMVNG
jgi:hypothetical protein